MTAPTQALDALIAVRDRMKIVPEVQGREFVSLGIQVNNAIESLSEWSRRSASPRAEVVPSDAAVNQWMGDTMILQVLADSEQVNEQEREVLTRWMAAANPQQAPARTAAEELLEQAMRQPTVAQLCEWTRPARTAADAPAGLATLLREARLLIGGGARFIGGDEGMAMCKRLDAALATIHDAPAAPAWKPALDIDGDPITLQRMVGWLDAKYRRHHEEEDKAAADFIRSFTAAPAAPSASEGVLGEPVARCSNCGHRVFDNGGHAATCPQARRRLGVAASHESMADFMTEADWQDLHNPNEGAK